MTALQIISDNTTEYKGYIHIAYKDRDGKFVELCSRRIDNIANFIVKMEKISSYNYYITANSTKTAKERNRESVFALNNLVIDIDCHKYMDDYALKCLIDEFIFRFKRDLSNLPQPNIIHRTGRGVQMWWHLEQAAAPLAFMYLKCVDMLIKGIEWLQEEYPELKQLEVDKAASHNLCGYFRMFDTYNSNTKTRTETEVIHTNSVNLIDLFNILNADETIGEQISRCTAPKKNESNKKITHFECSYISLQKKRIDMLKWLVKARHGDLEGSREILCFLYYNACIQLYNRPEAKKYTEEFNGTFNKPLQDKEISQIFDCLSDKYYKFRSETFSEWLGLSEDEQKHFERQRDSRNAKRNAEISIRKSDKQKIKQIAADMIKSGKYKYADIVKATGLSLSTVRRIAGQIDKPISKEKPWEKLGVSRTTYYTKIRKSRDVNSDCAENEDNCNNDNHVEKLEKSFQHEESSVENLELEQKCSKVCVVLLELKDRPP